jgi:hypothetical protein
MRGALAGSGLARAWLLAASAALSLACGEAEEKQVAAAPPVAPEPLSGLYEVSGTTVDKATGAERKVSGTLIVDVEGETYTTTFDLATNIVIQGDSRRAELIGKGEGKVADRTLDGTAQTQLIVALVPGVDASFGMLPRHVTARILNSSHAVISPEGAVRIEIDSEAAPGSDYVPTHTQLRGKRIAAKGVEGLRPPTR